MPPLSLSWVGGGRGGLPFELDEMLVEIRLPWNSLGVSMSRQLPAH